MRILIITTPLPSPGSPNSLGPLEDQLESLKKLGIDVSILELKGQPQLKYLFGIWNLWSSLAGIDIVHGHHGYCGWVARCQFSRPVVVSFMGEDALGMPYRSTLFASYYRIVAFANRWLAKWVDAVIVKSAEMKNALQFDAAHVIPNGVDISRFHPMDQQLARATLGWSEKEKVVLFGANPDEARKNFALAEESIRVAEASLGQPIKLLPLRGIEHSDVPLYMNACDAMLFTSKLEGSPNVVKEAMACNLPVLSVPVADIPWLFQDAPGYHVCTPNANVLAEALVTQLTGDRKATNGVQSILEKELTLQATATRIAEIYNSLLSSEHSSR